MSSPTAVILVNTSYSTMLALDDDTHTCNTTFQFGERGTYDMDEYCNVITVEQPIDSFMPVIIASLIVLFTSVIYMGSFAGRNAIAEGEPVNETTPLIPREVPVRRRLVCIDTLRGLCVVLMVFVNYGGGGYTFFHHATWDGLTIADILFPLFMFIMGTSMAFSFDAMHSVAPYTKLMRVIRRSMILFLMGLFIMNQSVSWTSLRYMGVLQRFGISYLLIGGMRVITHRRSSLMRTRRISISEETGIVSLIMSHTIDLWTYWVEWIVIACIVTSWIALTFGLPVPGGYIGPGGLADGGQYANCTGGSARYIDAVVMGVSHMYAYPSTMKVYQTELPYDPEGLLGTFMSIFAVFLGLQVGNIFTIYDSWRQRVIRLLAWSIITGLLAGLLCNFTSNSGVIPINKNLWSLSFVLIVSNIGCALLALLYIVNDEHSWWMGEPMSFVGMNPLAIYLGHEIFQHYLPIQWNVDKTSHSLLMAMHCWGAIVWIVIASIMHYHKCYFTI